MDEKTSLLCNPYFTRLIVSNAVGRFADALDAITFSWLMYLLSGDAGLIALVFAANYFPTILLQPFTGVLADRYSKKRIVALCDAGRALLALSTLLLFYAGYLLPWMLFPLTLAVSTLEAFRIPAGSALICELLPKAQIKAGNALNLTLRRLCEAIGTAAAGILIAAAGCTAALAVDAALFLLSGALVINLPMKTHTPRSGEPYTSAIGDLLQGFAYLRGKSKLISLICITAAFNFLSVPYTALQSLFFGETLLLSVEQYCDAARRKFRCHHDIKSKASSS